MSNVMRQRHQPGTRPVSLGPCPWCGGEVRKGVTYYYCHDPRYGTTCGFRLYFNTLRSVGKQHITDDEMKQLLNNETIVLENLIGRGGKRFSAGGVLDWSDQWGWYIRFISTRKTQGSPNLPRRLFPRQPESQS